MNPESCSLDDVTATPPVRVMLIDDHELLRQGVRVLLQAYGGRYRIVAEARDADTAVAQFEGGAPDVVVMDLEMKPVGGIELMGLLHRRFPDHDPQFVVFTAFGDKQHSRAAFAAGARGFVSKDSEKGELAQAIESVVAGRVHCRAEFHPSLWSTGRKIVPTHRELEVLQHMAVNSTSKYIGAQMKIHPTTVDRHKSNIMRKFDLKQGELAPFAVGRDWEI